MDGPASPHTHDNDGLCLPPNTQARSGGAEKKESPGHRLNPVCRQFGKPFLIDWQDRRQANARNADAACQCHPLNFCQSSANCHSPGHLACNIIDSRRDLWPPKGQKNPLLRWPTRQKSLIRRHWTDRFEPIHFLRKPQICTILLNLLRTPHHRT